MTQFGSSPRTTGPLWKKLQALPPEVTPDTRLPSPQPSPVPVVAPPVGGWTEERVVTLRELWQEGFSASQISDQMGGTTRNAVIGKVFRLKLSSRNIQPGRHGKNPGPSAQRRTSPRKPRARNTHGLGIPRPKANEPELHEEEVIELLGAVPVHKRSLLPEPESLGLTLYQLTNHICHFPHGGLPFTHCGALAVKGKPYCAYHDDLTHLPAKPKPPRYWRGKY